MKVGAMHCPGRYGRRSNLKRIGDEFNRNILGNIEVIAEYDGEHALE